MENTTQSPTTPPPSNSFAIQPVRATAIPSSSRPRRQRRRTNQSPAEIVSVSARGHLVMTTEEILSQILANLPAKHLFSLTLVSRNWLNVITHPSMILDWKMPRRPAAIYIKRHAKKLLYFAYKIQYNYIPLDRVRENHGTVKRTTVTLDFVNRTGGTTIINSCDGLFLCSSSDLSINYRLESESVYVYNPTTKHFLQVPDPMLDNKILVSMHLVFQAPNNYKIVCIFCCLTLLIKKQIMIFEPRTSTNWRETGLSFPIFLNQIHVLYSDGVFVDGVIYWPTSWPCTGLMYFSVKEEKIMWLPDVQHPSNCRGDILYFGECRGRLNMVRYGGSIEGKFDMLELDRCLSTWFIRYHVDLTLSCVDQCLCPLFVLAIIPGGEQEEGSTYLILHVPGQLVSYNVKDKKVKKLCEMKLRDGDKLYLSMPWSNVHPSVETFLRP